MTKEETNWIRAKDRMPEEDKKVLAIWYMGTNCVEMVTVSWNLNRGWYNDNLKITNGFYISFWTDLPYYPEKFWEIK